MAATMDPTLLDDARAVLPDAVALRRDLHRHPELGLHLPRTQARLLAELEPLGLDSIRLGENLSSVVADLHGGAGDGPTVLLRADMDALPMPEDTGLPFSSEVEGTMHACGHDAHVAMLVAAARLLVARRGELAGRVRFMFQPGEEGSGGARYMIEEGVLEGVDSAFALHVGPNVPTGIVACKGGPIMASADEINIRIIGRGGHASTPHWANDPIPVACEVVMALQTMVTRTVDAFNPAVLTVARISSGTTHNVIPESAELEGTLRTVNEKVREDVLARIRRVAEGVAAAHDCGVEVDIVRGYPVTVNDQRGSNLMLAVAAGVVGERGTFELPMPMMGAEDFSYVLQKVPGAMAFLGACPPDVPNAAQAPACHSNRMVLNEDAMAIGAALHVGAALTVLHAGGLAAATAR